MPSYATCASDSAVEIRLRPGCRYRLWQFAGAGVAALAVLCAGLSWPWMSVALLALWGTLRLAVSLGGPLRSVTVTEDTVTLEDHRGRPLRVPTPPRCRLQPGVITLRVSAFRRAHIFSDQCDDSSFRTLRRLLSAGT